MKLTGHSDFRTPHKYYLVVKADLVDRARMTTARGLCKKLSHFGAPEGYDSQLFLSSQKA